METIRESYSNSLQIFQQKNFRHFTLKFYFSVFGKEIPYFLRLEIAAENEDPKIVGILIKNEAKIPFFVDEKYRRDEMVNDNC